MGAYDRDYWKKPQESTNKKTFKTSNNNKKEKFEILVNEYNKQTPIYNRFYKFKTIIFWYTIILLGLFILQMK